MEGDGAHRAERERGVGGRERSLNCYSELPLRAAVVWDVWAGADVCMSVCPHLAEDGLILMEELGVSHPTRICVEAGRMSKALGLEEPLER